MYSLDTTNLFIFAFCTLIVGLYILIKGGDWTIDGGVYLAEKAKIPPLVIGFTIVAFGTSLPELLVSINANLSGSGGLAIGNVVGSNIANILLIIGITAAIKPVSAVKGSLNQDLLMMLAASLALAALAYHGMISRLSGAGLFAVLAVYVGWKIWHALKNPAEAEATTNEDLPHPQFNGPKKAILFLLLGLAAVSLGAELLVRGAIELATAIGVPESVIGLTIVAFGTSVPELAVSLSASKKGQGEIVLGNVIGSNVFNILSILGLTAIVKPLMLNWGEISLDLYIMLASSLGIAALLVLRHQLPRWTGFVMLAAYAAYIGSKYVM